MFSFLVLLFLHKITQVRRDLFFYFSLKIKPKKTTENTLNNRYFTICTRDFSHESSCNVYSNENSHPHMKFSYSLLYHSAVNLFILLILACKRTFMSALEIEKMIQTSSQIPYLGLLHILINCRSY